MFSLEQKLIGLLISIVVAIALAGGGYHYGHKHATTAAELAEAGRTKAALDALDLENTKVLSEERRLRLEDRTAFDKYKLKENDAKAETDRLVSDLQRDVKRLRAPVRSYCPARQDPGGPATSGAGEEGRAELTADASEFLVRLLARGDDGIRKHAEVVDRYERLRIACTAQPSTAPSTKE